jgi:CheY-like chemotaxis protein
VTSTPGEGSTFQLLFPCPASPSAAEVLPTPLEKATILVVDDEEMVRRVARVALEMHGHTILFAANGLEAIHQVRKHPEIDLVLLDLIMPVMGGEEAIDEILAARPGLRVLVSTGYDEQETSTRFAHQRISGFVRKPYTSRQLTEAILHALNHGEFQ